MASQGAIKGLAREYFPSFLRQRAKAERLNSWGAGKVPVGEGIFVPRHQVNSEEHLDLADLSHTPWLPLVTRSLVQQCFLDGVRRAGQPVDQPNLEVYNLWQRNRMDSRQISLYTASLNHGYAYGVSTPGVDPLTGLRSVDKRTYSALKASAFYDEDDDEWPRLFIVATPFATDDGLGGWNVELWDESDRHWLTCSGDGGDERDWTWISSESHGSAVCPVVIFPATLDLDGNAVSEIEPLIPLARRIDQDTMDRLVVQRFASWKVRYIAGLSKPASKQDQVAEALRLKVEDLLISDNPNTKFGTLDATDLKGFIDAHAADLRDMSAVSQTPPHHMLGLSSNLQAEALAAAEAGLNRNAFTHRTIWGESHEQWFRLDAHLLGNRAEAGAYDMQARWRDQESRSLEQAAQALSMMATNLKVPVEMLWERIPGWTDYDTERAKELVQAGAIDQLLDEIIGQTAPNGVTLGENEQQAA